MSIVSDIDVTEIKPVVVEQQVPERNFWRSLWRGFQLQCPACGKQGLLRSYLKVADRCPSCSEAYHHHQADDAPPYFTILIVGHIVVPLMLAIEVAYWPPVWLQLIVWPLLTLLLSLALLPRMKGVVVALQWAKRMHGFDGLSRP